MTSFLDNIPETESQTLKRLGYEIFTTPVFGQRFCDDCGYAVGTEAYAIFVILENSYFFSDTERSDCEALDMLLDNSFNLGCNIDEEEFSPDEIRRNFMDADSHEGFTLGFIGLVTELRKMLYGHKPNIELVRNFIVKAMQPFKDDLFEQRLSAEGQLITHSTIRTKDLVRVLLGQKSKESVGLDCHSLNELEFIHQEVIDCYIEDTEKNPDINRTEEEIANISAEEYRSKGGSVTSKEKMVYQLQLEHIAFSQFSHAVMQAMNVIENARAR
jgi:hypothetical protein